mgnify:CR=1 FL=1
MKIALAHDWLTGMRGGEYVLEAIVELFPGAELFTLLAFPESVTPELARLKTHTSCLQRLPGAKKRYRHFLPLMPWAIESFDLSSFDLVISSSHCVAKGVKKAPDAVHVSYVHAPMRYMWDRFDEYFGPGLASFWVRLAAHVLRPTLQKWDRASSSVKRIDRLVANSQFIAGRIRQFYDRGARVVHPFADLTRFARPREPGASYLIVGAMAPYKRIDLAIEAFNRLGLPLTIVGSGQDEPRLRRMAAPNVQFVGSLSNEEIELEYSHCRAFIFPGEEDFGITPLEAMAAGAPVIAFGGGGAIETVTEETGLFFHEPTVESLMLAVESFERGECRATEVACRARAAHFTRARFQRELAAQIVESWRSRGKSVEHLFEAAPQLKPAGA